jgi:hypothetical protein
MIECLITGIKKPGHVNDPVFSEAVLFQAAVVQLWFDNLKGRFSICQCPDQGSIVPNIFRNDIIWI